MTDQTAQEPTMEEILASIRRIISEDDAPAEVAAETAEAEDEPAPFAETAPEPEPVEPEPEEEVLELTQRYEEPAEDVIGDLELSDPEPEPEPVAMMPEPEPEPAPVTAPVAAPSAYDDALVGESAAASAASAFAGLAASFKTPEPVESTGSTGPTIDDLARSLLRPMLKDWLDAHLPGIVDKAVRKEVERIARSAG